MTAKFSNLSPPPPLTQESSTSFPPFLGCGGGIKLNDLCSLFSSGRKTCRNFFSLSFTRRIFPKQGERRKQHSMGQKKSRLLFNFHHFSQIYVKNTVYIYTNRQFKSLTLLHQPRQHYYFSGGRPCPVSLLPPKKPWNLIQNCFPPWHWNNFFTATGLDQVFDANFLWQWGIFRNASLFVCLGSRLVDGLCLEVGRVVSEPWNTEI